MEMTKWNYRQISDSDKDLIALLAAETGLELYLVKLLVARGINSKDKIIRFINPHIDNLYDFEGLADITKAVERINRAIDKNENIWIYGDYDVDGMTATALLVLCFRELGVSVKYHIPDREDGYGLNIAALEDIKKAEGNLVITVDCGINAIKEVTFANSVALDIIITDHHNIDKSLPDAFVIINPKRQENEYIFKDLAGVGTAFMLLCSLFKSRNISLEKAFKFLDIVAIGTIGDIMPLIEDNRIFVKNGLELLKNSSNLGLKSLMKAINFNEDTTELSSTFVAFRISPLFNACGRIESAKTGVELLIAEDIAKAELLVNKLLENNKERQKIEQAILKKVVSSMKESELQDMGAIIVHDKDYHQGVIGIVASKLCEQYSKPTIIIKIRDDGTAVASARSPELFNITEAFCSLKELLIRYGGHSQAGGFTISTVDIPKFKELFYQLCNNTSKNVFLKNIEIETTVPAAKLTLDLITSIDIMRPFGTGNDEPIFSLANVEIFNARKIGSTSSHLMFDILPEGGTLIKNCVWFSKAANLEKIIAGKKYDIAFNIQKNPFNGRVYVKLLIVDVKIVNSEDNEYRKLLLLNNERSGFQEKSFFNNIKTHLIGNNSYREFQKLALRAIILENKNIAIVSEYGKQRGIKTIALASAIYYYLKDEKKSLLVINKDSQFKLNTKLDYFFDIIELDSNSAEFNINKDDRYPFIVTIDLPKIKDKDLTLAIFNKQSEPLIELNSTFDNIILDQ